MIFSRLKEALLLKPTATPPEPFGYKMAWFAVKSATPRQVADALELQEQRAESWKKGIDFAYGGLWHEGRVFAAPPISGWTLAVGWCASGEGTGANLIRLSSMFEEAQAFATHRVSEAHQWMMARNGTLVRVFDFAGDSAWVVKNSGDLTPNERELGFFDKPEEEWFVKEDHVMKVAGAWSVDPATLGPSSGPAELGIAGRVRLKPV